MEKKTLKETDESYTEEYPSEGGKVDKSMFEDDMSVTGMGRGY
jgi:hypothetical protein